MDTESLLNTPLALSWVLMAWIFLPFAVRPLTKNRNWFRASASGPEFNSIFALWNAYVITCWLALPVALILIHPQLSLTNFLLYFVAGSWWLRAIYEVFRRQSLIKSFSHIGLFHQGFNLVVLLIGIFLIQSELIPATALNAQLDLVPSVPTPATEPADWLAYCFLVSATLTSSIQFYVEFIKSRLAKSTQAFAIIQKLDLACLAVGFSHLFFQTSLIVFINTGLLY